MDAKTEEIADGVHQLNVSRLSNCFLITEPVLTIVDSGPPMQAWRIAGRIADLGYSVNDVRRLILTHYDIDHIGSAQELHRVTGMGVYLHPLDEPYMLRQKPLRPPLRRLLAAALGGGMRYGPPQPVLPIRDGQRLDDILVIHTPGHTPGHACLLRDGVLFAGDLFITGEKFRLAPSFLNHDTEQAKESARKLLGYDFELAVSGHGKPVRDARSKLEELVRTL
jgi:glyoxylase-like metal-dependent hydrolase (beta-lactamase superfamily II)